MSKSRILSIVLNSVQYVKLSIFTFVLKCLSLYRKLCIFTCFFHELRYNPFLVYCRELAPGTVSLTGDRAQGDDSKHDSHYTCQNLFLSVL